MSLHSEFISLIAHMLYHRMLAKVFEVSTEQLLEFVELYLSGTVGVDFVDELLNVNREPKIMLDYFHQRVPLHVPTFICPAT